MEDTVIKNWKKIIKKLKIDNQISDVSYNTWIKPLEIIKIENGVVYIMTPLNTCIDFISKRYLQQLKEFVFVIISPKLLKIFFDIPAVGSG